MKTGEIFWVDLATGRRPGIVFSRERLNQGNNVVMALTIPVFSSPFSKLCCVTTANQNRTR